MLAGDSGPVRDVLALAGEPAGEGEGPRMPGRCGDVWGEKGDWAGLLCSPWLLDTPDVLTPGLRAPSVPVGRSSMDPDRSWEHIQGEKKEQGVKELHCRETGKFSRAKIKKYDSLCILTQMLLSLDSSQLLGKIPPHPAYSILKRIKTTHKNLIRALRNLEANDCNGSVLLFKSIPAQCVFSQWRMAHI